MPLQRWCALGLAILRLLGWGVHETSDHEDGGRFSVATSSTVSAPTDSATALLPLPPPASPPPVDPSFATQLRDPMESQRAMAEELSERRIAERSRELRGSALESSEAVRVPTAEEVDRQVIKDMMERLDSLEAWVLSMGAQPWEEMASDRASWGHLQSEWLAWAADQFHAHRSDVIPRWQALRKAAI